MFCLLKKWSIISSPEKKESSQKCIYKTLQCNSHDFMWNAWHTCIPTTITRWQQLRARHQQKLEILSSVSGSFRWLKHCITSAIFQVPSDPHLLELPEATSDVVHQFRPSLLFCSKFALCYSKLDSAFSAISLPLESIITNSVFTWKAWFQ